MTAATFDCPHCGAKYPVKPVLVGKTVRCTTCKNAFRLRADGIADKIEQAAAPQSAAPAPAKPSPAPAPIPAQAQAPAKPAPTSNIVVTAKTEPRTESKPAQPPISRLSVPTPKAGMTEQQLEARKAMSENLKAAMGDVLGLDDPEPEAAPAGKPGTARVAPGERKAKSSSYQKTEGGKKAGKSPVILTNEGEREADNNRRWLVGFLITIAVVFAFVLVLMHQNERVTAVAAFTAELPAKELRYGARLEAIRARAWMSDVVTFIDLPTPRISSAHDIPSASLEPLIKLKGLIYVASSERWVTPETAAWLAKQTTLTSEKINAKLERDGAIQVPLAALRKELSDLNLGDDEMTIVLALLTKTPAGTAANPAPKFTELIAKGQLPTIHWCTVSGHGGTHLFDPGQGYRTATADYRGLLVSFTGDDWPTGWRFMTLAAVK